MNNYSKTIVERYTSEVLNTYVDDLKGVITPFDFDREGLKSAVEKVDQETKITVSIEVEPSFDSYLNSLVDFMVSNLNIQVKPLICLKEEGDNFDSILIQTGCYDLVLQKITLYTKNRHPKDILRTLAHEFIHHKQNLENRLFKGNNLTDINVAPVEELEREAYEEGNILFRRWEGSIKNLGK